MTRLVFLSTFILFTSIARAQEAAPEPTDTYRWPHDTLVRQKLEQWRDYKFGIIIHWGLYSVPGIIESWALCSEPWIERDSNIAYADFKKWYWGLRKDFNPVRFNPALWAKAAKQAGMRYLVFTTKHHDGFCMFDTKETDFSIMHGPFGNNPRANVAKQVFDAFRNEGFMIGAYFSKPDWHSPYYWWPKYATPDRNNNYDIRKYPWRWERFRQYTFNQLSELTHNFGKIDILWLDGGWVRPLETVNAEVRSWGASITPWSQDINMPAIANMARHAQPGILIVDRTVHGAYEDYRTPEQHIPAQKLDYPWESCITLGSNWGYVPGDKMKSPGDVIHTLIEVVAKGGNLLLGVGPRPDGTLSDTVLDRLNSIGEWMKRNGESIYETRALDRCRDRNVFFTRNPKNQMYYAIATFDANENVPPFIEWHGNLPRKGSIIKLLYTGTRLKWKQTGDYVRVFLPRTVVHHQFPALALSFTPVETAPQYDNQGPK